MDLEFKRKKGKYIKKWQRDVSGGPKKKQNIHSREKEKSLCDRSIDGADDEILLHPPPADLFELENVTQKRRNVTRSRYVASVFFFLFFFSYSNREKTETSFFF